MFDKPTPAMGFYLASTEKSHFIPCGFVQNGSPAFVLPNIFEKEKRCMTNYKNAANRQRSISFGGLLFALHKSGGAGAGIVVCQNLFVIVALQCQTICTLLAHSNTVSVAPAGEGEGAICVAYSEIR